MSKRTVEWRDVPTSYKGGVPAINKITSNRGGKSLYVSNDLATAERCDVLWDGGKKIALRFHSEGAIKARATHSNNRAGGRLVIVRKLVSERLPKLASNVEFTREGDLIVIDMAQFEGK